MQQSLSLFCYEQRAIMPLPFAPPNIGLRNKQFSVLRILLDPIPPPFQSGSGIKRVGPTKDAKSLQPAGVADGPAINR
jgi:hypothetical protein